MFKYHITKIDLERLYLQERKSSYKIAKIYGCHPTLITRYLKKFRIEIRKSWSLPRKKCIVCENSTLRTKGAGSKYCSSECFHKDRKGKPLLLRRRSYINICEYCKKEFVTGGRKGRKKRSKFCSKDCSYLSHSTPIEHYFEERITKNGKIGHKRSALWRRLRDKMIKRDNDKCRFCKRDFNLQVHHIKPRKINGIIKIDNSEENLITVCRKCHNELEWLTKVGYERNKDFKPDLLVKFLLNLYES